MSTSKEYMVTSMEQILVAPKHMQQENRSLCKSLAHLQCTQTSTSLWCIPTTPP